MAQPTMPTASIPQARTSALRSPIREATAPAGRSAASWATQISESRKAATLTSAPSDRAVRTTTGRTAPVPTEPSAVGP